MAPPRLIVLAPSHYCERARWALDHAGIAFREIRWAVGPHLPLVRCIAPQSFVPILDTGRGIIQGSDRILDWIGLDGGAPEIERRLEEVTGPLVRRYLYAVTLPDPRSGIREALLDGVPAGQRWLGRLMWPLTRRLMVARMDARAGSLPEMETQLAAELLWFDGIVGDRPYLVGDRLGRADITAASLLAPLVRGPAVVPLYDRVRLPASVEQALAGWNTAPSLRWVRRLYDTHRNDTHRNYSSPIKSR